MKDTLNVVVRSRRGLIFEGPLAAVSSYNTVGPFDVLPEHSNFVSMISKKLVLHKSNGKKEEMWVDKGVMVVEKNSVQVFVGIGTL